MEVVYGIAPSALFFAPLLKNFTSPVLPSGCTSSSRHCRALLRSWKKSSVPSYLRGPHEHPPDPCREAISGACSACFHFITARTR